MLAVVTLAPLNERPVECLFWVNRVSSHPLQARPLKASDQTFSIPISSCKERRF